jgi:8-oxo-dGTP diphosphatase
MTRIETSNVIDNVALVYLRDRKVLVTMSRGKNRWYLPGGKREPGESDAETLRREVREELGVDIRPETARHLGTYEGVAHGQTPGTRVRMACYIAHWAGEPRPAGEIEQLAFLGFEDVADTAPVVQLVFQDLRSHELI